MRANPRTRIRPAAHTHAHIHIYTHVRIRTHVYTHTKEFFWHRICSTTSSNRVPSSVRHHSLLLSNRRTNHIHIGTTLAVLSAQTIIISHHLIHIYNYPPTIQSSLTHLPFIITDSHHNEQSIHASYSIFIWFPVQLTILSICQYFSISVCYKPCQFSICLPHSHLFSHLRQFLVQTDYHYHLPIWFTIIIFIMETIFRANHQQFPLCIIIHLLIFVMKFIWNRFV